MDAVGAVGGALGHLVQEHHVALPLLDPHGPADQVVELGGERGQLVEVGGEQRAAAVDLVQVLDHRPGDREAIEGRGAAADLVQDHEALRRRLIEDRRGLDHLDHEGRAAARQIVRRPDAREQPIDHADLARSAGTKLPAWARIAISAFWRKNVLLPAMFGPVSSHRRWRADRSASLAMNGVAARASACSTTGWRPP